MLSQPPSVTPQQLAALQNTIPLPATATPPAIADTGTVGSQGGQDRYALANHTHASKARRARMQCAADGLLTWTFDPPFPVGTLPRVQAIVEGAAGLADILNVQVEGTPTSTQVRFRVNRAARQGGAVGLAVGSIVLSVQTTPGVFWVHMAAFEG